MQHAEHYFRLIASAQQAQMGYARQVDDVDEDGDDDDVAAMPDRFASPPERVPVVAPVPQPYQERQPYQAERQPYHNGERGAERGAQDNRVPQERGNYERQNRGDRPQRPQRPYRDQDGQGRQDRGQDFRGREQRTPDYQPVDARDAGRSDPPGRADLAPREANGRVDYVSRERETERQLEPGRQPEPVRQVEPVRQPEPLRQAEPVRQAEPARTSDAALPAFITAPVRVAPAASSSAPEVAGASLSTEGSAPVEEGAEGALRFPVRRRRRTRAAIAADLAEAAARAAEGSAGNE